MNAQKVIRVFELPCGCQVAQLSQHKNVLLMELQPARICKQARSCCTPAEAMDHCMQQVYHIIRAEQRK